MSLQMTAKNIKRLKKNPTKDIHLTFFYLQHGSGKASVEILHVFTQPRSPANVARPRLIWKFLKQKTWHTDLDPEIARGVNTKSMSGVCYFRDGTLYFAQTTSSGKAKPKELEKTIKANKGKLIPGISSFKVTKELPELPETSTSSSMMRPQDSDDIGYSSDDDDLLDDHAPEQEALDSALASLNIDLFTRMDMDSNRILAEKNLFRAWKGIDDFESQMEMLYRLAESTDPMIQAKAKMALALLEPIEEKMLEEAETRSPRMQKAIESFGREFIEAASGETGEQQELAEQLDEHFPELSGDTGQTMVQAIAAMNFILMAQAFKGRYAKLSPKIKSFDEIVGTCGGMVALGQAIAGGSLVGMFTESGLDASPPEDDDDIGLEADLDDEEILCMHLNEAMGGAKTSWEQSWKGADITALAEAAAPGLQAEWEASQEVGVSSSGSFSSGSISGRGSASAKLSAKAGLSGEVVKLASGFRAMAQAELSLSASGELEGSVSVGTGPVKAELTGKLAAHAAIAAQASALFQADPSGVAMALSVSAKATATVSASGSVSVSLGSFARIKASGELYATAYAEASAEGKFVLTKDTLHLKARATLGAFAEVGARGKIDVAIPLRGAEWMQAWEKAVKAKEADLSKSLFSVEGGASVGVGVGASFEGEFKIEGGKLDLSIAPMLAALLGVAVDADLHVDGAGILREASEQIVGWMLSETRLSRHADERQIFSLKLSRDVGKRLRSVPLQNLDLNPEQVVSGVITSSLPPYNAGIYGLRAKPRELGEVARCVQTGTNAVLKFRDEEMPTVRRLVLTPQSPRRTRVQAQVR